MQLIKGRTFEVQTEGFTWGDTKAGAAGQFAHIQLFNPVASGVSLFVRAIVMVSLTAQEFYLGEHNTQIGVGVVGVNLRFGGAASKGQVSSTSEAGQLGTVITFLRVLASTLFPFPGAFGFVLPPGKGIVVVANSAATQLYVQFVWSER